MPGLARAERFAHRQEEKQGDEKPRRAEDIKGAAPSQQLRQPPPPRKAEPGTDRHARGIERQSPDAVGRGDRTEEQTSELQSLMRNSYAGLFLKKKNNKSQKTKE